MAGVLGQATGGGVLARRFPGLAARFKERKAAGFPVLSALAPHSNAMMGFGMNLMNGGRNAWANAYQGMAQGQQADQAGAERRQEAEAAARRREANEGILAEAVAAGIITQPIADAMTDEEILTVWQMTRPNRGEAFTLGENEVRYGSDGRELARGPAGAADADFAERPLTPEERTAFSIPANSQQTWVMTREGPQARGSVPMIVNNPGENAYDRAAGEQDATNIRGKVYTAEANAILQLQTLDAMEAQMNDPNFVTGFAANPLLAVRRLGAQLGIADADAAASIEAFATLAKQAVLARTGGSLGSQISNSDRTFIEQQVPNLANTAEGNREIIRIMRLIERRNIEIADLAREYERTHEGRLDPSFQAEVARYANAHPLFADQAGAIEAGTPDAEGWVTMPDGVRYRVVR